VCLVRGIQCQSSMLVSSWVKFQQVAFASPLVNLTSCTSHFRFLGFRIEIFFLSSLCDDAGCGHCLPVSLLPLFRLSVDSLPGECLESQVQRFPIRSATTAVVDEP
jgi:hypothetical protein